MVEVVRIEGKVRLERSSLGLDVAEDIKTLLVPLEIPSEDCR